MTEVVNSLNSIKLIRYFKHRRSLWYTNSSLFLSSLCITVVDMQNKQCSVLHSFSISFVRNKGINDSACITIIFGNKECRCLKYFMFTCKTWTTQKACTSWKKCRLHQYCVCICFIKWWIQCKRNFRSQKGFKIKVFFTSIMEENKADCVWKVINASDLLYETCKWMIKCHKKSFYIQLIFTNSWLLYSSCFWRYNTSLKSA